MVARIPGRRARRGAALVLLLFALPAAAATLEQVRERGVVRCGVNPALAGFSSANSLGVYAGFDVDLCRAVAAAVLGDDEAVEAVAVGAAERFAALRAGRFDVLSRNTAWTLDHDARHGEFAGTSFHDGQGFMVRRSLGARSALELDARSVCLTRNTASELGAADFFTVSELRYRPVYYDDDAKTFAGYASGECEAVTSERSVLAARRSTFEEPEAHVVLPEVVSKEPLGPMVRADDAAWENVVRWTLNCMINAEELGVTSDGVAASARAATPDVARLLGIEGDAGDALGLSADWCANVVRLVGNYGEVYERHIGADTPLGLPRGMNALWSDGGLLYAPPVR